MVEVLSTWHRAFTVLAGLWAKNVFGIHTTPSTKLPISTIATRAAISYVYNACIHRSVVAYLSITLSQPKGCANDMRNILSCSCKIHRKRALLNGKSPDRRGSHSFPIFIFILLPPTSTIGALILSAFLIASKCFCSSQVIPKP